MGLYYAKAQTNFPDIMIAAGGTSGQSMLWYEVGVSQRVSGPVCGSLGDPGGAGMCVAQATLTVLPTETGCPQTTSISATLKESLTNVFPGDKTGVGAVVTVKVGPNTQIYNGVQVTESVTASTSSCPAGWPNVCTGSSTFTVGDGLARVTVDGQNLPAPPNNSFYDEHSVTSASSLANAFNITSCTATCSQTYSCNGQSIGTHVITYKFTKGTISGTSVTNVSASVK
jgi:hypothetical protein